MVMSPKETEEWREQVGLGKGRYRKIQVWRWGAMLKKKWSMAVLHSNAGQYGSKEICYYLFQTYRLIVSSYILLE